MPGKKRVFLVNSFLESTFNKTTFALRDKKVLAFDRDKVDSLELSSADKALQFAKHGGEWSIVKPLAARADFGAVEGALERIASVQMQAIVADSADDAKKFGLDKPSATINVGLGSSKATLLLGKTENAVVYAKDAARPMVFRVAPTLTTDLFKDVGEYRRKDLFDSRSFNEDKVTFTRGSETVTLEEQGEGRQGDSEEWREGRRCRQGRRASRQAGHPACRQISGTGRSPALKTPALTVTAQFDNKTETVAFARAGATVVASRNGEPGSASVDAMAFDELMKAIDAVKRHAPPHDFGIWHFVFCIYLVLDKAGGRHTQPVGHHRQARV